MHQHTTARTCTAANMHAADYRLLVKQPDHAEMSTTRAILEDAVMLVATPNTLMVANIQVVTDSEVTENPISTDVLMVAPEPIERPSVTSNAKNNDDGFANATIGDAQKPYHVLRSPVVMANCDDGNPQRENAAETVDDWNAERNNAF